MAYIAPSATDADKKKNELLQKIIEKAVPLVDLYSIVLINKALGRDPGSDNDYDSRISKYEKKENGELPFYILSSKTLADFIQKIIWPQTYKFDSGWTDPPNQDTKSCAMRGISLNQITDTSLSPLIGTRMSNTIQSTGLKLWASLLGKPETDPAVSEAHKKSSADAIELTNLINQLSKDLDKNIDERKRVLYALGGHDLISSLFYTQFLCSNLSGGIIQLMAVEPYLGYLYADIIWSSGMNAISGVDLKTPALGIVANDTSLKGNNRDIYAKSGLTPPDIILNRKIASTSLNTWIRANYPHQMPKEINLDDKDYKTKVEEYTKKDKLWLHVVPTLIKRHLQIVDLTNEGEAEKFKKYFEDAEARLGFNPFDTETFKKQATQRLGLNGSSLGEVSNLSMLAIIGELLCNNQASFQLNKLERNFLNVKYALYSNFTLTISS